MASILYTEVEIGSIGVSSCDVLYIYGVLPAFSVLTLNTWVPAVDVYYPRDIIIVSADATVPT